MMCFIISGWTVAGVVFIIHLCYSIGAVFDGPVDYNRLKTEGACNLFVNFCFESGG